MKRNSCLLVSQHLQGHHSHHLNRNAGTELSQERYTCLCVSLTMTFVLHVCVFGRGWFGSQGSTASLTGSEMSTSSSSSIDLTTGEGAVERWGVFGPRPQVSKSTTDPGTDPAPTGKAHNAPYAKTEDQNDHNQPQFCLINLKSQCSTESLTYSGNVEVNNTITYSSTN